MKVYISCPIHIPEKTLKECVNLVKKLGHTPDYWERGSHYDKSENVKNCDVFVMFLPDGKFMCSADELTIGCKLEFKTAVNQKKPILIAYESKEGVKIYTMTQHSKVFFGEKIEYISGVSCTGNTVLIQLRAHEVTNPNKTIKVEADYTVKIIPSSLEYTCKLEDLYPKTKVSGMKDVLSKTLKLKLFDGDTVDITCVKTQYKEYDRRLLLLLR